MICQVFYGNARLCQGFKFGFLGEDFRLTALYDELALMLDFSFMLAVKVDKVAGTGFSQSYNSFVRC